MNTKLQPTSLEQTQPSQAARRPHLSEPRRTVIKAIGLGGGGSNAIDRMIQFGIQGVDFIAANTDAQALESSRAPRRILLGQHATRGLGSGGDPEIGAAAALESREYLEEALRGADMIFLACGMGGGTGTGAIPVVAEIARSTGALTIAVVTTPFGFEGSRRHKNAQQGLAQLRLSCDTLIVVPNDRLLKAVRPDVSLDVAFCVADDVLRQGIQGIAELITRPGMINVDFAHIRSMMQLAGGALLAVGQGSGEHKAMDAIDRALNHPLLDTASIEQAAGILIHFTGGDDLTLFEVGRAVNHITNAASIETEVVFGASVEPAMTGRAQVIMVATGVGGHTLEEVMSQQPLNRWRPEPVAAPAKADRPTPPAAEPIHAQEYADVTAPPPEDGSADADPRQMHWVVAEPAAVVPDNIDIPAFLRRRRVQTAAGEPTKKAG